MLKAASRDNRKNKMGDVEEAKQAYKAYLKRYAKQNGADARRAGALEEKAAPRTVSQQLPLRDFEQIDCFFESFARKFRDRKAVYLRKMYYSILLQEVACPKAGTRSLLLSAPHRKRSKSLSLETASLINRSAEPSKQS